MSKLSKEQRNYLIEENEDLIKDISRELWAKEFSKSYPLVKLDKDDFYSLVGVVVCENIDKWDFSRGDLKTYLRIVIRNKAKSYIKQQRCDKRNGFTTAVSLNTPIVTDKGEINLIETIPAPTTGDDENSLHKIGKYLKTLSNMEKNIIIGMLLGMSKKDMATAFDCDRAKIKDTYDKLTTPEKISLLRMNVIEEDNYNGRCNA